MDVGLRTLRIDDPHEPRARVEPLRDLREVLAGSVVGREDFRDEVRCQRRVAVPWDPRGAFPPNECDVRTSNGVGAGLDSESRILSEHGAQPVAPNVVGDEVREICLNPSMLGAGRLADEKPPALELGALVRHAHVLELLGRQESRLGRHGHGHTIPPGDARSKPRVAC